MQNADATKKGASRAQSAIDFLVTYGWALLIVAVVLALLYSYTSLPANIVPGSCNFYSSISCTDIVFSTNSLTLYLINSQTFPISGPALYASINGHNTVTASCVPDFVLPGGLIACAISPLPVSMPFGTLAGGSLYLTGAYCGLATNYVLTGNCVTAPTITYSGSFSAHSEPQPNPMPYASNYTIYITAQNATQSHGTARDPLYAQVMLGNYPVEGMTVSFSLNNAGFFLQTPITTTNVTGGALDYVWGGSSSNIIVTVSIGTVGSTPSNTVTISFT